MATKIIRPTGYTVLLPPGWTRVPLRHRSRTAIGSVVDMALRQIPENVPRDTIPHYRAALQGRLEAMARQARGQGGVDLYLPIAPSGGVPVSASFLISEAMRVAPVGTDDRASDPAQVLAYLESEIIDGEQRTMTIDDTTALRIERTAPPDEQTEFNAASRRVDYILPFPADPGRWLISAFNTHGAGDPDDDWARALLELFDAIMSTFRWTWPESDG